MSIKSVLKGIVGEKRLSQFKGTVFHYGCMLDMMTSQRKPIDVNSNSMKIKYIFSDCNFHIYRGYYDIDYLNSDENKFLCHRLPTDASNNKKTQCEVGYYDLVSGKFNRVAKTNAWCWQQGSRLRWHPANKNLIVFNDVGKEDYCTKVFDVDDYKCVRIIDYPLYDITPDFKYGISLNFSRLQRLRPGYGYNFFEDNTISFNAPEDDGIFIVDIKANKQELLFSLKDLAKAVDADNKFIHYVNHISISPDGKNFMFFHIYVNPGVKGWKTVLYVAGINGKNIRCLETADRVSHYCWIDNSNLMVTCRNDNGTEYYCTYNIESAQKTKLCIDKLNSDGHPSRIADTCRFITDTYPLEKSRQHLRSFCMNETEIKELASMYHDYRLRGEKRCDLHPVISCNGKYISVDTTYEQKRRSIVIFEHNME